MLEIQEAIERLEKKILQLAEQKLKLIEKNNRLIKEIEGVRLENIELRKTISKIQVENMLSGDGQNRSSESAQRLKKEIDLMISMVDKSIANLS